jgi:hypothetical protein
MRAICPAICRFMTGRCVLPDDISASLPAEGTSHPLLEFHEILSEGALYSGRFTMSGVHKGPFMGVPATGRPYAIGGITIMRFAAGRVVERWSSADMLGLMVQIGAIELPE